MIKLIATDMDGTFLDSHKQFDKEFIDVFYQMKEKDIQRINELYNLDKSIGLTPEQKEEQRKLRHEYIQSVRANLRAQLNNVSIKNEDGSITPLKPKGLN